MAQGYIGFEDGPPPSSVSGTTVEVSFPLGVTVFAGEAVPYSAVFMSESYYNYYTETTVSAPDMVRGSTALVLIPETHPTNLRDPAWDANAIFMV